MTKETASLNWRTLLDARQLQTLLDDPPLASHPGQAPWGYYLALDGDQLGYFCWFASQQLMLQHLVHIEMWHAPLSVPDRSAYEAKAQRLQSAADTWLTEQSAEIYTCFNQEVQGVCLKWLGNWETLKTPEPGQQTDPYAQPFVKQLLASYQQASGSPKVNPDVNPDAFADFLESYGL